MPTKPAVKITTKIQPHIMVSREYRDGSLYNESVRVLDSKRKAVTALEEELITISERIKQNPNVTSCSSRSFPTWFEYKYNECSSAMDEDVEISVFISKMEDDHFPESVFPYKIVNIHSEDGIILESEAFKPEPVYLTSRSLKNLHKELRVIMDTLEHAIAVSAHTTMLNTSWGMNSAKAEYIRVDSTKEHFVVDEFRLVKR